MQLYSYFRSSASYRVRIALALKKLDYDYRDEPRRGDHICYISNLAKFRRDYPAWQIQRPLDDILAEMVAAESERAGE